MEWNDFKNECEQKLERSKSKNSNRLKKHGWQ